MLSCSYFKEKKKSEYLIAVLICVEFFKFTNPFFPFRSTNYYERCCLTELCA